MTFGGESDDLKSSSPGERWRSSEPPRGEALTGFAPNGIFGGTDSRGRGRGGAEGEIFIRLQRNCIMVNSGGNGVTLMPTTSVLRLSPFLLPAGRDGGDGSTRRRAADAEGRGKKNAESHSNTMPDDAGTGMEWLSRRGKKL